MKNYNGIHLYENVIKKNVCDEIINHSSFKHNSYIKNSQNYDLDIYSGENFDYPISQIEKSFEEISKNYPDYPKLWINVMRYQKNTGMISLHQDNHSPKKYIRETSYTIMVYLNDIEAGGETIFYFNSGVSLSIKPIAGNALVIPGNISHEARPPISDLKYIALSRYVPKENF